MKTLKKLKTQSRPKVRHVAHRRQSRRLVYGLLDKGLGNSNLVFILAKETKRLAAIHTAIATAKTWGAFCRQMPVADLKDMVRDLREREFEPRQKTDPFDHDLLPPSYSDGDWPGWPEQMMLRSLPREICAQYGRLSGSVFNGPFLIFDVSRAKEIVQALTDAGFHCRHDPRLIRRACGY
jgi:hypothetical protein